MLCSIVAGETDTLCKGNSDGVVDIDTTIIDDQCQYSVSVPTCMPQKDCADNEISQLDTLRLSSFPNYEVCTVVLYFSCIIWNESQYDPIEFVICHSCYSLFKIVLTVKNLHSILLTQFFFFPLSETHFLFSEKARYVDSDLVIFNQNCRRVS